MGDLLRLVCEEKGHVPRDIDPTGGDPSMGGPVAITVCDRCGWELPHSEAAIRFNNEEAYAREAARSSSILRCHHYEDEGKKYRRVPCPPGCPRQSWPRSKFKRSFITGKWKLKKEWRSS